jgi:hypothetical protein
MLPAAVANHLQLIIMVQTTCIVVMVQLTCAPQPFPFVIVLTQIRIEIIIASLKKKSAQNASRSDMTDLLAPLQREVQDAR